MNRYNRWMRNTHKKTKQKTEQKKKHKKKDRKEQGETGAIAKGWELNDFFVHLS